MLNEACPSSSIFSAPQHSVALILGLYPVSTRNKAGSSTVWLCLWYPLFIPTPFSPRLLGTSKKVVCPQCLVGGNSWGDGVYFLFLGFGLTELDLTSAPSFTSKLGNLVNGELFALKAVIRYLTFYFEADCVAQAGLKLTVITLPQPVGC